MAFSAATVLPARDAPIIGAKYPGRVESFSPQCEMERRDGAFPKTRQRRYLCPTRK